MNRFGDWMLTKLIGVTEAEAGSSAICGYCAGPRWVQCTSCYVDTAGRWVRTGCRNTQQTCY